MLLSRKYIGISFLIFGKITICIENFCTFQAFGSYRQELQCDAVVKKHFNSLSDSMLEKDLCRIIEPYSYVQIDHIATKIGLDRDKVEKKLSQMILDKKFSGTVFYI